MWFFFLRIFFCAKITQNNLSKNRVIILLYRSIDSEQIAVSELAVFYTPFAIELIRFKENNVIVRRVGRCLRRTVRL